MASSSDAGVFARLRAAVRARFRLYADWKTVLAHAWSIRLAIIAALLSGAEVVCAFFTDNPPIERGLFAGLAGVITVAAALARLFAQTKLGDAE